ncbi:TonB-dependent receptor [Bacteroides thetaiotaomicron]|uniref:SusC/RagA family TonB-linked outer membrane protein n=1 Tax=Bacteroides thetaiotaomicron TaxID=818 RepID=UPI001CE3373C|nr:TonB-dependent receptor [Bacteroides thetaiotaomicron]MCA6027408.1 TonB-dependent receptor [Bacteroides thetaiotaomicron]
MINEKQNGGGRILQLLILFCLYGMCTAPLYAKQDTASPQQTGKSYTIKGIVLDFNNEPIIGASVYIPGTNTGVATDLDGNFTLKVPANTKTIEFSYIGFEKKIIEFNPKNLNIFRVVTMKEDSGIALEDVTIVAFAKQKKESVLGSVSTIKPAELKTTSSNLTTGFAGKLAGVVAYQRSGEPGEDNAEFFIRGVTTFGTGKADPLILIDNIELTSADLARLNTDDIASFSILKDATATALYGARGANGVILVTTKEGTEGKMKLSFRVESSFSAPSKEVEIAEPLTFMKLHNEAVRTRNPDGALPYLESAIAAREKGLNPNVYPMVNWKDMLFRDFTTNYRGNMSLSGGGRVARYYVALSYSRDNGILKQVPSNLFDNNIQLNKYTVRSNININLTKTTELGVRVSGTFDSYQGPLAGGSQVYSQAIKASPVLFPATYVPDAANQHANYPLFGNYGTSANYLNPYAEMARGYKEYENTVVLAQLELKQDFSFITQGLKGRLLGNVNRTSYYDLQRSYTPFYYALDSYDKTKDEYILSALNPDLGTDYLGYSPGAKKVGSSLYLEASLSYDRTFEEKHNVSGMLVYTVREGKSGNESTLQKSLPTRNLGLAGRFTYGFSDRYFAEFNFGYNGSERFDKNHRWGFFPSGGLGWVVSNEKFWKDKPISKIINMFKLKGSYGLVGNDNISDDGERFFYLSEVNMNNSDRSMHFGTNFDTGYNGISINRYANPKIGWEISHKLNVGFEVKLFDDLEIQAEYFKERRSNILQERADIPSLMGFQVPIKANIGEAKGHGVDISLDYSHIFNKNLWATVRGNFTYASSEFSKYEEPDYSATPWRSKIGSKLSQTFGFIAERLFVDDEDVANSPKQQFGEYTAGDIKYKDINHDGIIDEQDKVPIGYPTTPEIIYGFGFSIGYKDFDFNCFFQGSARSSFFIDPLRITPFAQPYDPDKELGGKQANNALLQVIADNHWSEANQNMYAFWPRLSDTAINNNNQSSTWWLRDGTFLRMKSAEIGYTLPKKLTSKAKLENLRIYVSGTNLFNISKFKIWDTEMGNNGLGYPVQRVFNIGIQLSL